MIPAIILFFGMMILPESPRWLATKDRWEECERVLVLTHGKGDPNSPWVAREYQEIKQWLEIERRSKSVSYLELFSPRYINRTHIGLFTQIWSQLTGMNVMMYYITYGEFDPSFLSLLLNYSLLTQHMAKEQHTNIITVFTMAGLKGNNLIVSSSIQYVINVVMTVPALIWVDRIGRRPTLLVGSTLMMTWLFANAGILAVYGVPRPDGIDGIKEATTEVSGAAAKAVIACSYLFVASFAPTWGPVSWIYPPELFPNHLRGKAVALATSGNWAFNFALGYFVPPAFVNITWRTYILFGVFCIAMTIHVYFMFPETAGKPLEEVNEMFEDPNGIKHIGTPAWKTKNFTSQTARMEDNKDLPEKKISQEFSPERHENVTGEA